jgi:alpha-beta hydrolase superfamily lysophospholipase
MFGTTIPAKLNMQLANSKTIFCFAFLLLLGSFFSTASGESQKTSKNLALIAHGINLKPEKMTEIGEFWKLNGYEVSYLELSGHKASEGKLFEIATSEKWLQETENWLKFNLPSDSNPHSKIVFVGFSLGALVYLNSLLQFEFFAKRVKAAVLFAPAIKTHWYASLPKYLWNDLKIPSASVPSYRAHNFTPVAAYKALFKLQENILVEGGNNPVNARKLWNVPTLVFLEPRDELVSQRGTQEWVSQLGLNNWQLIPVSAKNSSHDRKFAHLIIDSLSVGIQEWNRILNTMQNWISNGSLHP